jgi:AcrR family transcriptional regulator
MSPVTTGEEQIAMARKPALAGADRRQLILDAALNVFAEQGFDGATTKDIASRAGVTHGLIYFYFDSKPELFQAVFEATMASAFRDLPLASATTSDEPPAVVIERCVALLLDRLSSPKAGSLARLMMRMAVTGERNSEPMRACKLLMSRAVQSVSDAFAAYLDAQIAAGRLRPVDTNAAVSLLIGGVIATFRATGGGAASEESEEARLARVRERARAYTDILLCGMLPHPT